MLVYGKYDCFVMQMFYVCVLCASCGSSQCWSKMQEATIWKRSGVNRVQVVLSGFSVRLFCFVQAKTLCMYGCMYFLAALVLVCVDVMVISSA